MASFILGIDEKTLDRLIQFFGKTDGRDKFAKFLQNLCRYLKHYSIGEKKTKYKGLQDSLSEFRSIIKFFKPLSALRDADSIVQAGKGRLKSLEYVQLTGLVSDIGYKIGDSVEYLSKYRVLPFREDYCEFYSKTFQFFAYTCDVLVGVAGLKALHRNVDESEEKFIARRKKLFISFIGDFADWLRVLPGFCGMYKLGGLKKHDGFSGVMGVVVGLVGVYKVWKKCKA